MNFKLGSLFDGSGGFPLSGTLCDIEPRWAAEVEPYPIAVTTSRFPNMKHLGDISKVNGAEIEPVDIITFGSPCQDLSVAGKRAGLKHEDNGDDETTRSGLFMEAIRIIKEMRKATNGQYPRFAVWENVPGAFSSNNGEDFRIVLQEFIKVTEQHAVMPEVPKNGWAYADTYCGDGWSIAYRVFDAQYWGVPQRRRRIYLVADFGGGCAEKILFEREGLRGYFEKSGTQGQAVTANVERSIGTDDKDGDFFIYTRGFGGKVTSDGATPTLEARAGTGGNNQPIVAYTMQIRQGCDGGDKGALIQKDKSATLLANNAQYLFAPVGVDPCADHVPCTVYSVENHPNDSRVKIDEDGKVQALTSRMGTGGGNVPLVMQSKSNFIDVELEVAVRKYDVDKDLLQQCLRDSKGNFTNKEIAEALGKPLTLVEHWFRQDKSFAIPDADVWFDLKRLLGINTDEFDAAITTFEHKGGNYDMRNRIHTSDTAPTLTCGIGNALHLVPIVTEEKPRVVNLNKNDVQSKTILDPKGIAPSLYAGECRGGGGECYVMEERTEKPICMATQQGGAEITHNLCPTITAAAGMSGNNQPVVAYGLDRASFNQGQNAKFDFSILDNQQPTLTVRGPGAVSYSFDPGASRDVGVLFLEECGKTLTNGTCPGHHDGVVISRPVHSMTTGSFTQVEEEEEKSPTLMARDYKDPTCVEVYDEKSRSYIVRRLTPTECARLQGFPDFWGHIEPKTELTDDEYRWWLEVRKTHDVINERTPKDYNEKQMLTWYNKLWTDSAEYKMWGNGIALPCALYVLQGIKESLVTERNARSKWLDDLLNT